MKVPARGGVIRTANESPGATSGAIRDPVRLQPATPWGLRRPGRDRSSHPPSGRAAPPDRSRARRRAAYRRVSGCRWEWRGLPRATWAAPGSWGVPDHERRRRRGRPRARGPATPGASGAARPGTLHDHRTPSTVTLIASSRDCRPLEYVFLVLNGHRVTAEDADVVTTIVALADGNVSGRISQAVT